MKGFYTINYDGQGYNKYYFYIRSFNEQERSMLCFLNFYNDQQKLVIMYDYKTIVQDQTLRFWSINNEDYEKIIKLMFKYRVMVQKFKDL